MSITLSVGLSDLSKELGETTTNTTERRIQHYNDAVIDLATQRKLPFLVKLNSSLSTAVGVQSYSITSITDMRGPGGIKEIYLGSSGDAIKPIDWEDRNDSRYTNESYFYLNPEETTIYFKNTISAVEVINMYYWYIPARITDTASAETFPIPDRYRKVIATCAGAFVQWSRYLESQGTRLYNVYQRMLTSLVVQQSETHRFKSKKLQHFLQHIGFRRTYP